MLPHQSSILIWVLKNNLYLILTPQKYIKQIVVKLFSISNCIKIKCLSQTIFYMQLDSIRNCQKKIKSIFGCKNRGLQLNLAKILWIYPIV